MKKAAKILALLLCIAGLAVGDAWAHGGRGGGGRVSVRIGAAWGPAWGPGWGLGLGWGPWWGYSYPYGPPAYVAPVVVAQPAAPAVYTERADQPDNAYWYYCRSAGAYYPYVKECREAWVKVPPRPER